jgi:transketolase
MRDAFAREVLNLGQQDDRVVLLMGDIGNRLFNPFRERFPDRFFNCGVAEANMMSVAAGMALSGLRPIVYTIVPFVTTRCLEQIRVDVCYHNAPVVIVGVGGGLSYAELGATHHACEDIAFLRQLPGMAVVCPADPFEVVAGLRAAFSANHPTYLRIGKKGEPKIHKEIPTFQIGKGIQIRAGEDVCLLSTGHILPTVLQAAEQLQKENISARVVSFHTVKPLDQELLDQAFANYSLVATIEEHSIIGGLGSAVAEWLSEQRAARGRLLRIGTPDKFLHVGGSEEYVRREWGLDAESMVRRIRSALVGEKETANGH